MPVLSLKDGEFSELKANSVFGGRISLIDILLPELTIDTQHRLHKKEEHC